MINNKNLPLIIYVHVPKTAGSTVNEYMRKVSNLSISHCESIINIPEQLNVAFATKEWISGHVPLSQFEKNIEALCKREVRYFTSVREPLAQIMSHYNWLIEIFHQSSNFYNGHPDKIKIISTKIRESDNSNPYEIIQNLKQFSGLFLNFQSRIVLGNNFDWNEGRLHERLSAYTFVSTSKNIPKLLFEMTGHKSTIIPRVNTSSYHFDKEVFSSKEISKFLLERNFLDLILYQAILDRDT